MKIDRVFAILSVLILLAGGAYIYACQSPNFDVRELIIRGNCKISQEEIKGRMQPFLNKNVLGLNLRRMEETLRSDPRLQEVRIKRRLPGSLLIEVKEKKPVLWVSLPAELSDVAEAGFCGLSLDQEMIPLDGDDLARDLPVVTGIVATQGSSASSWMPQPYRKWDDARIRKAVEIYRTLTEIDPASSALLSEINLSDPSNPVLYLLPGIKMIMGQSDFQKKWKRVRGVLGAEKEITSFSCLDLRFNDQILLTKTRSGDRKEDAGKRTEPSEKE
jgi:cell division protein FtsQ